jgi:hypothetical protein
MGVCVLYAAANGVILSVQAQAPPDFVRRGKQLGSIEAILRTNGPFQIVYHGDDTFDVALQISRNLYQYFYADSSVLIFKLLVTIGMLLMMPQRNNQWISIFIFERDERKRNHRCCGGRTSTNARRHRLPNHHQDRLERRHKAIRSKPRRLPSRNHTAPWPSWGDIPPAPPRRTARACSLGANSRAVVVGISLCAYLDRRWTT